MLSIGEHDNLTYKETIVKFLRNLQIKLPFPDQKPLIDEVFSLPSLNYQQDGEDQATSADGSKAQYKMYMGKGLAKPNSRNPLTTTIIEIPDYVYYPGIQSPSINDFFQQQKTPMFPPVFEVSTYSYMSTK